MADEKKKAANDAAFFLKLSLVTGGVPAGRAG
jgi:hypothetical protein